jgi:hypothetical protein
MLKSMISAAALTLAAPIAAHAVVFQIETAPDGAAFPISAGDHYTGEVKAGPSGGAGSYAVTFNATQDPLYGNASVSLNSFDVAMFDDVVVSWLDADDDSVLSSAPVMIEDTSIGKVGLLNLATTFGGDALSQNLQFAWEDSEANAAFDFDVVAAVPLPASIWLFGAALGGVGLMRRRSAA